MCIHHIERTILIFFLNLLTPPISLQLLLVLHYKVILNAHDMESTSIFLLIIKYFCVIKIR